MRWYPSVLLDAILPTAPDKRRVSFLSQRPFAHRGLHGRGVVENSPSAFRAAVAGGYGIELDVQASRDGEAMVFHDATLERLTDSQGRIDGLSSRELHAILLRGTNEPILPLLDILNLIAGKVPVLIEVKTSGSIHAALCLSVRRALEGYNGPAAIMSFNPDVPRWFAINASRITRGLVVTEEGEQTGAQRTIGWVKRWIAARRAHPDFLAYDVRDLPSPFAGAMRRHGIPVVTWTVRDAAAEQVALAYADEAIFERAQ